MKKAKCNATTKPQVVSLFSGCGGLDLGFHLEGYDVVWSNEFNKWAADTYELNFKGSIVDRRSVLEIDPYKDTQIPSIDLIIGGFPCQDFSTLWKSPGMEGDRGSLYQEFVRFIDAKKPKAFVAENVKGMLSANGGRAIQQIICDFEAIKPGYTLSIKLYNFADYGVPQFRQRVLIVGVRNDTGFDFEHPNPTHGPKIGNPYFTAGMALKGVEAVAHNNEHNNITQRTKERIAKIREGKNHTDIPMNDPHHVKGFRNHEYRRIHREEPSKTVIAAGGGASWGYHYPEPRPLTNRERARLQTFPDWFLFTGPLKEVRRQIGNAVPPEGVRLLARNLKQLFSGDYKAVDLYAKSKNLKGVPLKKRIITDRKTSIFQK